MANIQYDTCIFNLSAEQLEPLGYFTYNIGIPLLIILWWLGFALANKEISKDEAN